MFQLEVLGYCSSMSVVFRGQGWRFACSLLVGGGWLGMASALPDPPSQFVMYTLGELCLLFALLHLLESHRVRYVADGAVGGHRALS